MPVAGIMWATSALGIFNGFRLLRSTRAANAPVVVMLGVLCILTVGLIGLIIPESRFVVIPVAILSVLSVHYVLVDRI